jgi:hypothetical protein
MEANKVFPAVEPGRLVSFADAVAGMKRGERVEEQYPCPKAKKQSWRQHRRATERKNEGAATGYCMYPTWGILWPY